MTDEKIQALVSKEAQANLMQTDLKAIGISDYGEYGQYGHLKVIPATLELFFAGKPMQTARYPARQRFFNISDS